MALGKARPFVVFDVNTHEAAGRKVLRALEDAGIPNTRFIYPRMAGKMEPDEAAVGGLAMAFDPACDVVLAVGSGVINDCCKVLAHAIGVPSIAVGTAPSMDGYASNSSSMIQNKVKVSLYNACPAAIVCDTDIMREAPMHMLLAGLGDMMAKYISICEWRISHLITGEYYCENIARLMRVSLRRIMAAAEGLIRREPKSVEAVVEGLVLSGVAMGFAGISRPASGLEHYFSHMWEMMALERGGTSDLHGTQVGVGTALTLSIFDKLRTMTPSRTEAEAAMRAFDRAAWEKQMHEIFGRTAGTIIEAERTVGRQNDPARYAARLDRTLDNWQEILAIMAEELPDTGETIALMQRLGMKTRPKDLGISTEDTQNAYIGSRVIRDKYLTSTLIFDLGWEQEFVKTLRA